MLAPWWLEVYARWTMPETLGFQHGCVVDDIADMGAVDADRYPVTQEHCHSIYASRWCCLPLEARSNDYLLAGDHSLRIAIQNYLGAFMGLFIGGCVAGDVGCIAPRSCLSN